jgi:general secretion pathway protein K
MPASRLTRRGVAMLTALATLVLIAALSAAIRRNASSGVRALARDVASTRARWVREGCAAVGLALANEAIQQRADTAWLSLDQEIDRRVHTRGLLTCRLQLAASGATRNVNSIDSASLVRLFAASGVVPQRAEHLTAALLDWRDVDARPRSGGAEREWYTSEARPVPRDADVASMHEVRLIRGFEDPAFFRDTIALILGVDSARVSGVFASDAVLQSLAGLSLSDVTAWKSLRQQRAMGDVSVAPPQVTGALAQTLTGAPEYWTLTASDSLASTVYTLARASRRVAVVSVRELP